MKTVIKKEGTKPSKEKILQLKKTLIVKNFFNLIRHYCDYVYITREKGCDYCHLNFSFDKEYSFSFYNYSEQDLAGGPTYSSIEIKIGNDFNKIYFNRGDITISQLNKVLNSFLNKVILNISLTDLSKFIKEGGE